MVIYVSLLVAIIGAFVYALSSNAKAGEFGRVAFFVGLLAFLIRIAELPAIKQG